MVNFYDEISKLKEIERRGWKLRNIDGRKESDAEHTYSMILMALNIMSKNDLKLDSVKVLKMIAYHELCEIDAGDTTPFDNISKQEKYEKEYACIKRLSKEFDMPEIENLWLEFEANKTTEARFVKDLDKYDAIKQAQIYSQKQNRPDVYLQFYERNKEIYERMKELDK